MLMSLLIQHHSPMRSVMGQKQVLIWFHRELHRLGVST